MEESWAYGANVCRVQCTGCVGDHGCVDGAKKPSDQK